MIETKTNLIHNHIQIKFDLRHTLLNDRMFEMYHLSKRFDSTSDTDYMYKVRQTKKITSF